MTTYEPLRCKVCGGLWRECYGCSQWKPGAAFERLMARRGTDFDPVAPRARVTQVRAVRAPRQPKPPRPRKPIVEVRCQRAGCGKTIRTQNPNQKYCDQACSSLATAAKRRAAS